MVVITMIINRIKTGFCKQGIILCNFKLYHPILHIITELFYYCISKHEIFSLYTFLFRSSHLKKRRK